jgi:excisionase family DNA binding protein
VEKLLTTKDVAQRLDVCAQTVRRLVQRGRLPVVAYSPRNFRFHSADVDDFLRGQRLTPKGTIQAV